MPATIKTLLVDDSSVILGMYKAALKRYPELEIIGAAHDPYEARTKIMEKRPDVIVSDINMPKMDGLKFLKFIMEFLPTPIVIVSKHVSENPRLAKKAKSLGAVRVLPKHDGSTTQKEFFDALSQCIIEAPSVNLRVLAETLDVSGFSRSSNELLTIKPATVREIIVIGSSTGGPESLERIMWAFPEDTPGMIIVQHMPKHATKMFAERLNDHSRLIVKEAQEGDVVKRGCCYVAQGGRHLTVNVVLGQIMIHLKDGPKVKSVIPSIDVTLESVARLFANKAVGVIMTGIGDDGADGAVAMKEAGNIMIAQDEKTSIVYGMPMEAAATGAIKFVRPLDEIPKTVLNAL